MNSTESYTEIYNKFGDIKSKKIIDYLYIYYFLRRNHYPLLYFDRLSDDFFNELLDKFHVLLMLIDIITIEKKNHLETLTSIINLNDKPFYACYDKRKYNIKNKYKIIREDKSANNLYITLKNDFELRNFLQHLCQEDTQKFLSSRYLDYINEYNIHKNYYKKFSLSEILKYKPM